MVEARSDALEALARQLEASPDYRVLRAVTPPPPLAQVPEGARVGVFLDLETTGLDTNGDALIELGLVRFAYQEDQVLGTLGEIAGFEDPGRPIPEEVTRLTGIDDTMVAGKALDDDRVRALVDEAVLVVAHNAGFDRPIAERRFPFLAELAWACTQRDVAWREEGFESSGLQALVMVNGAFFEGHRAVEDCYAGLFLLNSHLPRSDETVLRALRRSALRREVRLWAAQAPFEHKDLLKQRGYRWSPEARSWWCDVREEALAAEEGWLREHVYGGRLPRLPQRTVDAYSRYSQRVGDTPA